MSTLRPVLGVVPLMLTQVNCEAAVGLKPRRFLELIIEHGIPCTKLGQLRLVSADAFMARFAARDLPPLTAELLSVDDEADRVLATIGRRLRR